MKNKIKAKMNFFIENMKINIRNLLNLLFDFMNFYLKL